MRFLAILLLITLSCFSAEALKKRQVQQDHAGYCPMHRFICEIACPIVPIDLSAPKPINSCITDSHCGVDEKCCKPACGCTNKCTKALAKPGYE